MTTWLRTHRSALECASLLTAVVVVSMSLSWLSWHATSAAREATGGGAPPAAESTLVADLTTSSVAERRSGAEPYTTRRQEHDGAETGRGAAGAGAPATSGVGGEMLSMAAVGAVLLAGLVVARLVLRRYRASAPDAEETAADTGDEHRPADRDEDRAADPDEHPADVPDDEEASGPPDSAGEVPEDPSPDAAAAVPDSDAGDRTDGPAASTGGGPRRTDDYPAGQRYLAEAPTYASRERVYERRAAPRVAYECDGHLRGRQQEAPVTVLDLSETGLRCRSSSTSVPKANDYVQVTFPLGGELVTLTGQVSWRRTTADGTDLGVHFQRLSEADSQRLRATCLQHA